MIQFIGAHLGTEAASVAIVAKDLTVSSRASARMLGLSRDAGTGASEVPPLEWVRAGTYAVQEAYFRLPARERKPWGLALSGPTGWIALDVEYEPMSPLRLLGGSALERDVLADVRAWIARTPRAERKIAVILSPKDYFRFAISGGLAADVTDASRLGLLREGQSRWAGEAVAAGGLESRWLPPVFDSHVATGRLSEDGVRATSLPGGSWVVAGAHEDEARLVAAGDLRRPTLWVVADAATGRRTHAYALPTPEADRAPAGWAATRSAVEGRAVLRRQVEGILPPGDDPDAEASRRALEAAGLQVSGVRCAAGAPEEGAALLAALGSGLVRRWDAWYAARDAGR